MSAPNEKKIRTPEGMVVVVNAGQLVELSTKYDDISIKFHFYSVQPLNYLDRGCNKIFEIVQPIKSSPNMSAEAWALGFCQSAFLFLEKEDAKIYNYIITIGDRWYGRHILVIRNKNNEAQGNLPGKKLCEVILLDSSGDFPESRN